MTQETMSDLRKNILFGMCAERNRKAWHYDPNDADSVANHIDGPLTRELIEDRLFNFTIDEQPIYFLDQESGVFQLIEGRKAMVTSDTQETLGVFKAGYQGHDYRRTLLDTLDHLVGEGVGYGTAGLLKNRAQAFVQLELPENFDTNNGVRFRPNLGAVTSFDGSLATTIKRGYTVWQCDNTLAWGLREDGEQYKVKHSKYSKFKLANAREALDLIAISAQEIEVEINNLCAWEVTDKQFSDFLAQLSPIPEIKEGENTRGRTLAISKAEVVRELYETDHRAAPWRGTAFGVQQAVSTYNQHESQIRGTSDRDVRRFENFFSGKTEALDNNVLDMLAQVCEREYA